MKKPEKTYLLDKETIKKLELEAFNTFVNTLKISKTKKTYLKLGAILFAESK